MFVNNNIGCGPVHSLVLKPCSRKPPALKRGRGSLLYSYNHVYAINCSDEAPLFVPSSSHSSSLLKRARGGQPESSTSSAPGSASATLQPPRDLPQPPQVLCVLQRSDLGTCSAESLRQLGDEELLWLHNNAFIPHPLYAFPAKEEYGKKRSFQHAWIKQFPWLCYSMVVFAVLVSSLLSVS